MNTWYTTNKAAIDSASLAASTMVASWALYLDLELAIASTDMMPPPSTNKANTEADETCTATANTSITFLAAHDKVAAVGTFGDNFSIGVVNKTTTARTPLLRWGNIVTQAATVTVSGTSAVGWHQYVWTDNATISDYSKLTTTQISTLSGAAAITMASTTDFGAAIATTGSELTCDTTKWASSTACDGVTRWGLGTTTEWTSTTALGSKRAWLWLADANPTTKSAVFGIEKDDVINFTFYQGVAYKVAAAGNCALDNGTINAQRSATRFNYWGVATFTHAGASATLLGASAVMAALISFF